MRKKITILELLIITATAGVLLFSGKWMAESYRKIYNGSYSFPWELRK